MTGRVLLIPALLVGLCVLGDPPRRSTPRPPVPELPDPDATSPVVAVRGEPLAPYEEPLPAGARVRIGSTRFRHPTELDRSNVQLAGPYFVSQNGGALNLTDVATGRRLGNQLIPSLDDQGDPPSVTASPDGRVVSWNFGSLPKSRVIAQVWNAHAVSGPPLRLTSALRIPEGVDTDFVDGVFFPEDASETWVLATNGIHAFDSASGEHLRDVRTRYRILAMDRRGTRFLTSTDHDPRFALHELGGFRGMPMYRFTPNAAAALGPRPRRPLGRFVRGLEPEETEAEPLTLIVADGRNGDGVCAVTIPRPPRGVVSHLDLSSNGRYLSYEVDCNLTVFDIDGQRPVLQLDTWEGDAKEGHLQISESWFSDDGTDFTVAGRDIGEIRFDLATGAEVPPRGERPAKPDRSYWLAMAPRGPARTEHGVLRRPGREPLPPGYAGVVLGYCPAQRLIAVGDATGRLDVWHQDGRLWKTLRTEGQGISAVAFSPDGRRLAACDRGRAVRTWVVGSWRECDRFDVPASAELDRLCPEHLVFSPDGRRLLVARGDICALWDFETRTWVWDVLGSDLWSRTPPPAFLPDGSGLLCHGHRSWFDAQTGHAAAALPDNGLLPARGLRVWSQDEEPDDPAIALSPDGSRIAVIDDHGRLQVSDTAAGSAFRPFPESSSVKKRHGLLRFSPDGRRLVTCDDAGHAHVWEVATRQLAFTLAYPDGAIHDVHFGRDGRTLITANHREVIVWDLSPEPGASADPWADLGHEAPRAEQSRRALLADPAAAVALLQKRLHPAAPLNDADVRRLVRSLDADEYRERQRAAAGLLAAGCRVLPRLREAKPETGEGTVRLAAIIRDLSAGLTADERRHVRAVEVLEQIGTPAARAVIARLATGDPEAVLTEEARKSSPTTNGIGGPSPGRAAGHPLSGPAWNTATTAHPTATGSLVAPTGGLRSVAGARTTD